MSKYRIALKKETTGQILVVYEGGFLKSIILDAKEPGQLTSFGFLMEKLPYDEAGVSTSILRLEPVSEKAAFEKIRLFCAAYKTYCLTSYTISKAESGMIKGFTVTEPLLKVYFESTEWWAKVKSVTNYCRYINEIKRVATVGTGRKFPNGYDRAFATKLPVADLPDYWKHLRELGFKPKYNGTGELIDWTK